MSADVSPAAEAGDVDPRQFVDPIAFIRSEHDQQEDLCALLSELIDDLHQIGAKKKAETILAYLSGRLPLHVADEEEDLFRLLRQRCLPEDRIGELIGLLCEEHEKDDEFAQAMVAGLEQLVAETGPATPLSLIMNALAFAETSRRHVAWENTAILPLAEIRLTADDLIELGRSLAARRSLAYPD